MSRRDSELFDGHGPWNEQILLDQLAIGTPRAMDVFTSLAAALPDAFARKGARGERTLQEAGFVTEGLLAQNVARYKQWLKVRPVTWLQWGSKQDGGQEREWRNSDTHRGGRHACAGPRRAGGRPFKRPRAPPGHGAQLDAIKHYNSCGPEQALSERGFYRYLCQVYQ